MAFTEEIYEQIREGAQRSAGYLVPYLMRDVLYRRVSTVLDVGCGEGWFAREFARYATGSVLAYDETVENGYRDKVQFIQSGLPCSLPPADLAVCLEVAEHLPEEQADALVASLRSSHYVLFSAAIPGQGGHGHLNEQWPSYWADKFFEGVKPYWAADLRFPIWDVDEVEPWYRQNLLLFSTKGLLEDAGLQPIRLVPGVVHPIIWEHRRQRDPGTA